MNASFALTTVKAFWLLLRVLIFYLVGELLDWLLRFTLTAVLATEWGESSSLSADNSAKLVETL